jgi:hypothetical protein
MDIEWEEATFPTKDDPEYVLDVHCSDQDGRYLFWYETIDGKEYTLSIYTDYEGIMCVPTMYALKHLPVVDLLQDVIRFINEENNDGTGSI